MYSTSMKLTTSSGSLQTVAKRASLSEASPMEPEDTQPPSANREDYRRRESRIERYRVWRRQRLTVCKHYFKKFIAFLFSHIGLCCSVVIYSIVGGFIFQLLEGPNEQYQQQHVSVSTFRRRAINELWDVTQRLNVLFVPNWTRMADRIVAQFQSEIIDAVKSKGWTGSEDETEQQWTFAGALLYSVTVITTIGYGHITPKTVWGRVVTMFYALLGIPLMFLCLTNIGNFFADTVRFIYKKYRSLSKRLRRHHQAQKQALRIRTQTGGSSPSNHLLSPRAGSAAGSASRASTVRSKRTAYSIRQALADGFMPPKRPSHYSLRSAPIIEHPETDAAKDDAHKDKLSLAARSDLVDYANPSPSASYISRLTPANKAVEYNLDQLVRRPRAKHEKISVPLTCSILIIVVYIMGGACAFYLWEDGWDFLIGCYFCFITLSTIGFGDFVPGTRLDSEGAQAKLIFCALYLLFGLAVICMAFNLMQEEVKHKFRWLACKMGIIDEED